MEKKKNGGTYTALRKGKKKNWPNGKKKSVGKKKKRTTKGRSAKEVVFPQEREASRRRLGGGKNAGKESG